MCLSKNKYFSAATQQHEDLAKEKARGIKIKEKAIRGYERPISDFEKATQKKKKSKNNSKTSSSAMEEVPVTQLQPPFPMTVL